MENSHAYNRFRIQVKPALISKVSEFQLLGYDSVSEDELWLYLLKKKWKKPKEDIRLYEIIEDIMAAKVSDYISFTTLESYKASQGKLPDDEDWKELLK